MTAPLVTPETTVAELARLIRAVDVRVNLAPTVFGERDRWECHASGRLHGQRSGWHLADDLAGALDVALRIALRKAGAR